jgi:hypothetical protein
VARVRSSRTTALLVLLSAFVMRTAATDGGVGASSIDLGESRCGYNTQRGLDMV